MNTSLVDNTSIHSQKKRGFTLTEIAIVLGIIGVVLAAIWVAARSAYEFQKTTKLVQEITAISQSVRSHYSARQVLSKGCLNTSLANMEAIPNDMVAAAGTANDFACAQTALYDPWGNNVDIGSQENWGVTDGATNTQAFLITVGRTAATMSTAECSSVLTALVNNSTGATGLMGVYAPGAGLITDMTTVTNTTFENCKSDFTLEFSL